MTEWIFHKTWKTSVWTLLAHKPQNNISLKISGSVTPLVIWHPKFMRECRKFLPAVPGKNSNRPKNKRENRQMDKRTNRRRVFHRALPLYIQKGSSEFSPPLKVGGFLVFEIRTKMGVMKKLLRDRQVSWKGVLLERGGFKIVSSYWNTFFLSGKYLRLL